MNSEVISRIKQLRSSLKHSRKKVQQWQLKIEKDEAELSKLEKKIFICPACGKEQELPYGYSKEALLVCAACGAVVSRKDE